MDTNRATDVLAVGTFVSSGMPGSPKRAPHVTDSLEAIGIYDLNTGAKRKSLSLGKALHETARYLRVPTAEQNSTGEESSGLGVAALCFRQDGDVCAAYCPDVAMLCVWDLHVSWSQKLSKGPAIIGPVKVVQLGPEIQSVQPSTSSQVDLTYKLTWQQGNHVALEHGNQQLALVELHLGT